MTSPSVDAVDAVARAVLYEGYLLYPYTRSAAKNQVRWTFGGVHPPAWEADPSLMRTECLLRPGPGCRVRVLVHCLQLVRRTAPGELPWQEAVERTVADVSSDVAALLAGARQVEVALPAGRSGDGGVEREWLDVAGRVTVAAAPVEAGAVRLSVAIENTTPAAPGVDRDEALLRTMVSTHTVLRVTGGELVSLTDPPADLAEAAAGCANVGTWPVLAGPPGSRDTVLSSPIILEDHPRVAAESPGDLFDATEIDEILTLRILTLSDAEKEELRRTDDRGRELLERCESLTAEQLMGLHGTLRDVRPTAVPWPHGELRIGDSVRLRPRPGADIMDVVLAGRTARVESIVTDLEGVVQVAVVVDGDPGADMGDLRMPGHRFFFRLGEVEPA